MNCIDFLAILPLYIEIIIAQSTGNSGGNPFLNIIKIGRTFRLVKLAKYSKGMQLIGRTMQESMHGLGMLMVLSKHFKCQHVANFDTDRWRIISNRDAYQHHNLFAALAALEVQLHTC